MAYLWGGTELLPMLLALGAGWEGSHTVHVARDADQLTVVLGHERGNPARPDFSPRHQTGNALHQHGVAVRMFCLWASRLAREADHVAGFAAAQVCERAGDQVRVQANVPLPPDAVAPLPWKASDAFAATACASSLPALAVPQRPTCLALLRSVVLLV